MRYGLADYERAANGSLLRDLPLGVRTAWALDRIMYCTRCAAQMVDTSIVHVHKYEA
jgi:hypothetical protein